MTNIFKIAIIQMMVFSVFIIISLVSNSLDSIFMYLNIDYTLLFSGEGPGGSSGDTGGSSNSGGNPNPGNGDGLVSGVTASANTSHSNS